MAAPKGHKKYGGGIKKGQKTKKTIEQEMALSVLREEIRKHWEELINTKLELAKGIWVERRISTIGKKKMKVIVYRKEPDSNSLEYLFSIVVGKPKETLEFTIPNSLIDLIKNAINKPQQ